MVQMLGTYKFGMDDQAFFARLSGDHNPMHLDRIQSRREFFGDIVVHGLHGVLRILDCYFLKLQNQGIENLAVLKLVAKFPTPIFINEGVQIYLVEERDGYAKIHMKHTETLLIEISISWTELSTCLPNHLPVRLDVFSDRPIELSIDEIEGICGQLDLYVDIELARSAFVHVVSLLPSHQIAELLALTRLVGMECPGLYSLLSAFDVDFHLNSKVSHFLKYKVKAVDRRFSLVPIQVENFSLSGSIKTFMRPRPKEQPHINEIQKHVVREAFVGQQALIVGGSRGLGEITAKIFSAGGGKSIITYHQGQQDAQRVVREIQEAGLLCDALQCDISRPNQMIQCLVQGGYQVSQIYYFASPKIMVPKKSVFNNELFQNFLNFYVAGIAQICQCWRSFFDGKISVFYPSTTMLNGTESGMGLPPVEYTMAKSAGELLCQHLESQDSELSISIERLPRLNTDQTLALLGSDSDINAIDLMLKSVKTMSLQDRE